MWSWALYDWANSAFFTIILTFVFARYFSQSVVGDEVAGTEAWGNIVGSAGLVVALLAPFLGAIADRGGRRKPWLLFFTLLCVVASAMLWFVRPTVDDFWWAAVWVGVGILGAEFSFVFYNTMLPDLVEPKRMGRWSGWGWGLGYVGGVACLRSQMFGLFTFSGKATAFAGPLLVGAVTAATASQRWGMSTIVVFFAIGFVLMLTVPTAKAGGAEAD